MSFKVLFSFSAVQYAVQKVYCAQSVQCVQGVWAMFSSEENVSYIQEVQRPVQYSLQGVQCSKQKVKCSSQGL